MKNKIITNEELQEMVSAAMRDENEETINARKTLFIGAGKMLSSVKMDMEASDKTGRPYLARTKHFLGLE